MAQLHIDLSLEGMEKHSRWPGPYDVVNVGMPYGGPDRFVWPAHYHEALEMIVIPDNMSGCITISGKSFLLDEAIFLCVPPGHIHSYDLHFSGTSSYVIFLINPAFFPHMLSLFSDCASEQIRQRIDSLAYNHKNQYSDLNNLVLGLSRVRGWPNEKLADKNPIGAAIEDLRILMALLELVFSTRPVSRAEIYDNTPVKRAIAVIKRDFKKQLKLEQIARESSVSKYHLCRLFRAQTGSSLWAFVNSIRIQHASSLLSSKTKNVTEACYESGFTDPSYFAKVFKRHTGISPKKWSG